MRWLLTAETFSAAEAHRIGVVQEVVPDGDHVLRAIELAQTIARAMSFRPTLSDWLPIHHGPGE